MGWAGGEGLWDPTSSPSREPDPQKGFFWGWKTRVVFFGIRELISSAARWRMGENCPKSLKFIPKQREWKERKPLEKKISPS